MADTTPSIDHECLAIPGLNETVEIIVDQWGIAHIYAASAHDAFFAQGWNAARDRLWQIDLWRKRGLGLLSETFGPAYVAQDRATRLFLYRGDMDAEWAAYGPDAKAWSQAFVAGINTYVAQVLAGDASMPAEFELTSSRPALWQADDLVRVRSHGISNNAESEALRARVVAAAGGVEADQIRRKLDPSHELRIPDGLDPADIPADILNTYVLATKEVSFAPAADEAPSLADLVEAAASQGSNNW